ncbi:MAG: PEP-CTERM sorting domain-containing protein [Kiritimatiellaeota bacterium]|nr:PEP-CTERM sorting domain-containing protein [Kiritimatiellota bacterium]
MKRIALSLTLALFAVTGGTAQAQYTTLYSFTNALSDGANPCGGLILSGSTLYGLASYFYGTVFSLQTDGTGFTALHKFTGGVSDGMRPNSGLTLSGSMLYGLTVYGGANHPESGGDGVAYALHVDGSGYTLLPSYYNLAMVGAACQMPLSGSTLYGMGQDTNSASRGRIFSINTAGTTYSILRDFNLGDGTDGNQPVGSPILNGSTLYGMTSIGGSSSNGNIFSIGTDGNNFASLHSFSPVEQPTASLTLSPTGSKLYGVTYSGGSGNKGTIFTINTDGSGFTNLWSFTGDMEGKYPTSSLTLSPDGSTLYGTTYNGGPWDNGIIFAINADGSNFTNLYSFSNGHPAGDLTLSPDGSMLYGALGTGGTNGKGDIFSLSLAAVPEPGTLGILALLGSGLLAWRRLRSWRA